MTETAPLTGISLDYIALQAELIHTAADLSRLATLSATAGEEPESRKAADRLNHLASGAFVVAVIGQFNRGKSTLANALLGVEIMPSDIEPTTATINRVVYGRTPRATMCMVDSSRQPVPVDSLADYITKLTAESEHMATRISEALIEYPARLCLNNVQLLDTPGLDDVDTAMTERTRAVLSRIDAALLVTSALSPLEATELEVLADLARHVDVSRIFIVVNHADRIDEEDRPLVAAAAQQRAARALGADEPRLFLVSARDALRAKQAKDAQRLERSGFLALEDALEQFLVRDSGMARVQAANENLGQLASALLERSELRFAELKAVDVRSVDRLSDLERNLDEVVRAIGDWHGSIRDVVEADMAAADAQALQSRRRLEESVLAALSGLQFSDADIRGATRHAKVRAALDPVLLDGCDRLHDTDAASLRELLQGLAANLATLTGRWDDALKENVANEPAELSAARAEDGSDRLLAARIEQSLAAHAEWRDRFRTKYTSVRDMLSLKGEALDIVTFKLLSTQRSQVVAGFPAEYRAHVPETIEQSFAAGQRSASRRKAIGDLVAALLQQHAALTDRCERALDERKWILRLEREKIDKERVRAEERTLGVLAGAREIVERADVRRSALRRILEDVAESQH